ncbi:MAG: hypothetical protein MRZ79_13920 [Bacteroidia bacterium]|nr:hypothetical protein [Bacteroidia bacterium]
MGKKINWLNHIIEFIVVVISVLLAFQLNNWSVKREHKKVVSMHLDQIDEETRYNKIALTSVLELSEKQLALLDTLIVMLAKDESNDLSTINKACFRLLNIGNVYLKRNAYISLTGTGDIRFLDNFEEKNRVISLYEYYDWVESIERIAISNYNENFFPYMNQNFDMVQAKVQKEEVYRNKKFINALATYRYGEKQKVDKYKDCLEVVESFLKKE